MNDRSDDCCGVNVAACWAGRASSGLPCCPNCVHGSAPYPFYNGMPPHESSDTSIEAAVRALPTAECVRERVFKFIDARGQAGATDDEIERALNLRHQSASARRRELVLAHRIFDSSRRRKTSSGRNAAVWISNRQPELFE